MCDTTQGPLCPSPMKIRQCMWIQWSFFFFKTLNQRSFTPRWPLTTNLLRSHVWYYPMVIVSKSHENTSKYVDTVIFFLSKPWTKGHWPLDDLWPQLSWGLMCDSTQGSFCLSLMKIHQNLWIQWPFFKNLKQRSLTPRWPLTSCLMRSHVWLYPRIIVFESHGNTSMFVDTMINFAKYHILHATYYIHTYYIQNEWSHSLFLNMFRRDKNVNFVCRNIRTHTQKETV